MNIDYLYRMAEDIQNNPSLNQAERLRQLSEVNDRIARQNYLNNLFTNMGDSPKAKFELNTNVVDNLIAKIQDDDFFEAYKNPSPEMVRGIEIKNIEPFVEPARSGSSPIMGVDRTYGKNGVVLGQSPVSSGDALFGRDANFVPTPRPVPIEVGSFRPNISGLNNNVASMYNGASEALPIPTSNPVTPVTNASMNLNGFEEYAALRNQLVQSANEAKLNGDYGKFMMKSNFVLDMDDAGLEEMMRAGQPGWSDAARQELGFRRAVSGVQPYRTGDALIEIPSTPTEFNAPSTNRPPTTPGELTKSLTTHSRPAGAPPLRRGVDALPTGEEIFKNYETSKARPGAFRANNIVEELYGEWKLKPTTPASSADEVAEAATKVDDLATQVLKLFGKNPEEIADITAKLGKAGKGLETIGKVAGPLGIAADAAFGGIESYQRSKAMGEDEQAQIVEGIGGGAGAALGGAGAAALAAGVLGTGGLAIPALIAAGLVGSNLGQGVGQGLADLIDRGWGDDGKKRVAREKREEQIRDQLREMQVIEQAQSEIQQRNAMFDAQLAREAQLQNAMMSMIANANQGNPTAQLIQAIYG